jgi:hypothetical protein
MPGDEVDARPASRREEMRQKLALVETKARDLAERHGRLAAGIALTAAAALGLAVVVYRSRRRKSIVQRAQRAIPGSVRELPEELIAQVKNSLQRVAKAA